MNNRKYFIQEIKYDDRAKTLEVYWSIDKVWQHFNVPKSVYLEFVSAQNKEEFTIKTLVHLSIAKNGEVRMSF